MPDYQADSVLDTCQSFIDMGKENYLVSTFNERIASLDLLPENKKDSFQKENMKLVTEEIYPAYQNLITAIISPMGKITMNIWCVRLPAAMNPFPVCD